MKLKGRYLIIPNLYVGSGYESISTTLSKTNGFVLEAGVPLSKMQFSVGAVLYNGTTKYEDSDFTSTMSETLIHAEALILNAEHLPLVAFGLKSDTQTRKNDLATSTSNTLLLGAGVFLHF